MFGYSIVTKPYFSIGEKTIDNIFKTISSTIKKEQFWILNIVFLEPYSIKNLNKKYRNIDKTTDVLSFHYFDDFSKLKKDDIAWEIVMCEDKIKAQALEYSLWEEKEFYKLLIHSVLHILWYNHETDYDYKIMQEFENSIWSEVFEK